MKVLFIGGTGVISSACSELAVWRGIELYHLNRGKSAEIRHVHGVQTIIGDIRNVDETRKVLEGHHFDVVVDFIAYLPEHVENDIQLFAGKTHQYIFISSASAYQKPTELPVTENTPLENNYWEYSRNKIACENVLHEAYAKTGFPFTIVRPAHTYDKTLIPLRGGYTVMHRMMQGLPVVVHGDGTSIWTLTHNTDFAVGLVGLFDKSAAINQAFHITSNELLTWNGIYEAIAAELGVTPKLVHVSSEMLMQYDAELGAGLLGDKAHSMIFDNSKIKMLVPEFNPQIKFHQGAKEITDWYKENTMNLPPDENINKLMDRIVEDMTRFGESIKA